MKTLTLQLQVDYDEQELDQETVVQQVRDALAERSFAGLGLTGIQAMYDVAALPATIDVSWVPGKIPAFLLGANGFDVYEFNAAPFFAGCPDDDFNTLAEQDYTDSDIEQQILEYARRYDPLLDLQIRMLSCPSDDPRFDSTYSCSITDKEVLAWMAQYRPGFCFYSAEAHSELVRHAYPATPADERDATHYWQARGNPVAEVYPEHQGWPSRNTSQKLSGRPVVHILEGKFQSDGPNSHPPSPA